MGERFPRDEKKKSAAGMSRLALSLSSGLPNEQELALSALVLLSSKERGFLLPSCPPLLLPLLLAQAFDTDDVRELYSDNWRGVGGRHMRQFWQTCLRGAPATLQMDDMAGEEEEEDSLFNLDTPSFETEAQKVQQVALILHNASFEEENIPLLVKCPAFIRFLLLCLHSSRVELRNMALDTLPNVAHQVCDEIILSCVTNGLLSEDRFVAIRCMDALSKMAPHHPLLPNSLTPQVYSRLVSFLSVHDVMLLYGCLECLYALTSLGRRPCDHIAHPTATRVLVSLLTLNPEKYAHIRMKVIETGQEENNPTPAPPPEAPVAALPPQPTVATTFSTKDVNSETFATNWLQSQYEMFPGCLLSRNDIYADYVSSCTKAQRKGVVNASIFANCVKSCFPQVDLKKVQSSGGIVTFHHDGLRKKRTIASSSSSSPILQAQLSTPPTPSPIVRPPPNKVPVQQQQQAVRPGVILGGGKVLLFSPQGGAVNRPPQPPLLRPKLTPDNTAPSSEVKKDQSFILQGIQGNTVTYRIATSEELALHSGNRLFVRSSKGADSSTPAQSPVKTGNLVVDPPQPTLNPKPDICKRSPLLNGLLDKAPPEKKPKTSSDILFNALIENGIEAVEGPDSSAERNSPEQNSADSIPQVKLNVANSSDPVGQNAGNFSTQVQKSVVDSNNVAPQMMVKSNLLGQSSGSFGQSTVNLSNLLTQNVSSGNPVKLNVVSSNNLVGQMVVNSGNLGQSSVNSSNIGQRTVNLSNLLLQNVNSSNQVKLNVVSSNNLVGQMVVNSSNLGQSSVNSNNLGQRTVNLSNLLGQNVNSGNQVKQNVGNLAGAVNSASPLNVVTLNPASMVVSNSTTSVMDSNLIGQNSASSISLIAPNSGSGASFLSGLNSGSLVQGAGNSNKVLNALNAAPSGSMLVSNSSNSFCVVHNLNAGASASLVPDSSKVVRLEDLARVNAGPAGDLGSSVVRIRSGQSTFSGTAEVQTKGIVRLHIESPENSNHSTDLSSISEIARTMECASEVISRTCSNNQGGVTTTGQDMAIDQNTELDSNLVRQILIDSSSINSGNLEQGTTTFERGTVNLSSLLGRNTNSGGNQVQQNVVNLEQNEVLGNILNDTDTKIMCSDQNNVVTNNLIDQSAERNGIESNVVGQSSVNSINLGTTNSGQITVNLSHLLGHKDINFSNLVQNVNSGNQVKLNVVNSGGVGQSIIDSSNRIAAIEHNVIKGDSNPALAGNSVIKTSIQNLIQNQVKQTVLCSNPQNKVLSDNVVSSNTVLNTLNSGNSVIFDGQSKVIRLDVSANSGIPTSASGHVVVSNSTNPFGTCVTNSLNASTVKSVSVVPAISSNAISVIDNVNASASNIVTGSRLLTTEGGVISGNSVVARNSNGAPISNVILNTVLGSKLLTEGGVNMLSNNHVVTQTSIRPSAGNSRLLTEGNGVLGQVASGSKIMLNPQTVGGQQQQILVVSQQGGGIKFCILHAPVQTQEDPKKAQPPSPAVPSNEPSKEQRMISGGEPPVKKPRVETVVNEAPTPTPAPISTPKPKPEEFVCNWKNCGLGFRRPGDVFVHVFSRHVLPSRDPLGLHCQWKGCDPVPKRKRFSLLTHLQDWHCSDRSLRLERDNRTPPQPPPHPGYAPDAALVAIRRHAAALHPKEYEEDKDDVCALGRSIRLTAALVLRNLVTHSPVARRLLRPFEDELSLLVMSPGEGAGAIAALLHRLHDAT